MMPHLLIIDDDELVRDALSLIMASYDFQISSVASTEEAVEEISSGRRPDAILADYRLRGNDTGLRAIQVVRERIGQWIPAVILTGDTSPDRLREISGSGLPVLHKPALGTTLVASINAALMGRPSRSRPPRWSCGEGLRA